jgi:hypothetical protein
MDWRVVPERDRCFYAQSFHKAAKTLAGSLQLNATLTEWDVSPVITRPTQFPGWRSLYVRLSPA